MRFRPCIDIHNGKVKQIVGSSLRDEGDAAQENYTSGMDATWYARLFRDDGLRGGHVILLNHRESKYYGETLREGLSALAAWPGGLQIGGGVTAENAASFIKAGASHVIVTSYVFRDGCVDMKALSALRAEAGREHVVLDLSCRRREADGPYYIMTDRWQKYTRTALSPETMAELADYCDEFLVHAVAEEGKGGGIDASLAALLAASPVPVTYAGGIASEADLRALDELGAGRVDFTVGSALDLYGGGMSYRALAAKYAQ